MPGWRPTRSQPSHWLEHVSGRRSDETADYLKKSGGVKSGYAGHIPWDQIQVGKSHFLPARGGEAQRDHAQSKDGATSARATLRASRSLPGYAGHLAGLDNVDGLSFWTDSNPNFPPNRVQGARSASSRCGEDRGRRTASSRPDAESPWSLSSASYGSGLTEPGIGPTPPASARGRWVALDAIRDPDACALQPKHVRQIATGMAGPASVWVPPAGLYIENSKKGLGHNMWELRDGKRPANKDPWVAPPQVRDPDACALKTKHVNMMVKNLSGFKSSWAPPAGLYTENSKKVCGIIVKLVAGVARPHLHIERFHAACM